MRSSVAIAALLVAQRVAAQPISHTSSVGPPCAVSHATLSPALSDLIAPRSPVSLAATAGGAFVAFVDRLGGLRLARTNEALEPVGEIRELATTGSAFSMVAMGEGVAVAWVEDEHSLLLGLIDGENELRNVPRLLSATRASVERVLVARAGEDLAAAWSTASGAGVYAIRTDSRAVPRGGAQGMGEAALFDLAWLTDSDRLALNVGAGSSRWVISLDERGREVTRAPWPATARGPVTVDGVSYMAQLSPRGAPILSRLAQSTVVTEPGAHGLSLGAIERRDARVVLVINDARGDRATLTRLDLQGAGLPPVTLRAPLAGSEALAIRDAGEVVAVLREGRRMLVARARCSR